MQKYSEIGAFDVRSWYVHIFTRGPNFRGWKLNTGIMNYWDSNIETQYQQSVCEW